MKLLTKIAISTGLVLTLGATSASAAFYTVQKGDTLNKIVKQLGFQSIQAAGITSVPSGNLSKIYPGDMIEYTAKHKKRKRRFHKKVVSKKAKDGKTVKKVKFCFKDAKDIHYRASQRCK